jgi:stage II sporulation protein D
LPRSFHLLFIFALLTEVTAGRDVIVRLYSNQPKASQSTRTVNLEEYVAAVLAGESAGFRSDQALEAMAVAARTYAVRFEGRHKAEGFDFCDTTHCQDVRFSAMTDRLRRAAEATEGELLWFEGAPAATFYGKDCGGAIEAASVVWPALKAPYLTRREDPHCPRAGWTAAILKSDLQKALLASGLRGAQTLRVVERSASGRAVRLETGGMAVSASSLRFAVGRALGWDLIRSDLYQVRDDGNRFVFDGRGSGNGVGLCQAGAEQMGLAARNYREILEFYYPGTALGVSAQGFSWRSLGGERVELITTNPNEDRFLVPLADRLAREAEQRASLRMRAPEKLKIFPTVAAFRDSTGEPGWVAASSRGGVIRMQPARALRSRGTLESTLTHELLHSLIESHAKPGLPIWFREGVVLYLAGGRKPKAAPPDDAAFLRSPEEARRAYDAAVGCVTDLVARFGEAKVLSWIESGLPTPTPVAAKR